MDLKQIPLQPVTGYKSWIKKTWDQIKIPLPPLGVQKQIVAEIGVEQGAVEACRRLIGIYEGKVRDSIGGVWGGS